MTGSSPPFAGVPFGRYVIRRRLARGGMGEVFLADQLGPLGPLRAVALKRMLPRVARDPRAAKMFLEEMATAAQLNHPNVATTYDFGEVEGVYFLAMEYVDGLSLRQIVESIGPLPIADALTIAAEIAAALDHAHNRRAPGGGLEPVVHRDVSPHNVMISASGAVKLLDFGIARAEAAVLGGRVEGKLAYAAPEQLEGAPAERRSDLWALGVVLYEILSGVVPFAAADPVSMLEATRSGRRVPLAARRPEAAIVSPIVDRAMLDDPDARWPTAQAFGAACRALSTELQARGAEGRAQLVARAGGPREVDPSIGSRTGTGAAVDMATGMGVGLSSGAPPPGEPSSADTLPTELAHAPYEDPTLGPRIPALRTSPTEPAPTYVIGERTDVVSRTAHTVPAVAPIAAARTLPTDAVRTRLIAPDTPATPRDALTGPHRPLPLTSGEDRTPPVLLIPRDGETVPLAERPRSTRPSTRVVVAALASTVALILGGAAYLSQRHDPVEQPPRLVERPPPIAAIGVVTSSVVTASIAGSERDDDDAGDDGAPALHADHGPGDLTHVVTRPDVPHDLPRDDDGVRRPRRGSRAGGRATTRDRRTRESPAPSESPAGLGLLSVRTVPWSRVSVDGRELGHSPLVLAPTAAGEHTLVLVPGQGTGHPRTLTVHIRTGEVTKVFVDFERDTSRVEP